MPISDRKFRTHSARNRFRKNRDRRTLAPHKANWRKYWATRRKEKEDA